MKIYNQWISVSKIYTIISLLFLFQYNLFAKNSVNKWDESKYFTPNFGNIVKNFKTDFLKKDTNKSNYSKLLQQAIDTMYSKGGGVLYIPKGEYVFSNIKMKTNVFLRIDKGAKIYPLDSIDRQTMFIFGDKYPVKNCGIIGDNGKFTLDLTKTTCKQIHIFYLGYVDGFILSNFNVYDNYTVFPTIGITVMKYDTSYYAPKNGIIKDASAFNTHYGYGLIQVQAGEHIFFKNLYGTGGVTLRFETGWTFLNSITPKSKQPKVNDCYAENIICKNGQATVMLSPHTISQGFVHVRNIEGISCEAVVKVEGGFTTSQQKLEGLEAGEFSNKTVIENVHAVYGDSAQVRSQVLRFIPCRLQDKILGMSPDSESYIAPSPYPIDCSASGYYVGRYPTDKGAYFVQFKNISAEGFLKNVPTICTSDYEDYEYCNPGPPIWIPKDSRNTILKNDTISFVSGVKQNYNNDSISVIFNYYATQKRDIVVELCNSKDSILFSKKIEVDSSLATIENYFYIDRSIRSGEYSWKVRLQKRESNEVFDQKKYIIYITDTTESSTQIYKIFSKNSTMVEIRPNPVVDKIYIQKSIVGDIYLVNSKGEYVQNLKTGQNYLNKNIKKGVYYIVLCKNDKKHILLKTIYLTDKGREL